MEITRMDRVRILVGGEESDAVKIAASNLGTDIKDVLGCVVEFDNNPSGKRIVIKTEHAEEARKENYKISVEGDEIRIIGTDRRGTVYGIYTLSEQLGVSPWHFFADVPKKHKDKFVLLDGYSVEDAPEIEYRGIFINDEEELEHWVQTYMGEDTIGIKTYEKIFELLLRLKFNYIWPAMHVNSFNIKPENGALADRMGLVVGTSHCDMLMRSNNREWVPWLEKKGYKDVQYDFSIPGRNREILIEYWRESVQQNKDFEVSYTLGMRGIHDSGFNVRSLNGLKGQELLDAKIKLLSEVISVQQDILSTELDKDTMKIFVPYKEVLELYDNGLKVPEDLTLIWVNDNYGYVRRYPSEAEKKRKGGNGLYYHNSYWAPPGNSYMFICSIPLAHTKNELKKSYEEGIRKLWVTNFGTIKPHEMQMSFFADYAWEAGNEKKTANVDKWLENWLRKTFSDIEAEEIAAALNEFDQLTNVRKIEHLESDVFSLTAYGDEGAYRLHRYEKIFEKVNKAYVQLPEKEKDAFFQMVVMKVQAAYYSNAMFYYADRSRLCMTQGKNPAAQKYTILSLKFDRLRRKMLYYYNHIMTDGKWNNILTPEDFPPPRTAMYPACQPPMFKEKKGLIVTTWGGSGLNFVNNESKWIEVANSGEGKLSYEISAPEWVKLSKYHGTVQYEERIFVRVESECDCNGLIKVSCAETGETHQVVVNYKRNSNGFDDGRMIVEADKYSSISEGVEVIERLGRDRGSLVQLNKAGAEISYRIEVPETGEYTFVIHRFPSLNSVGRIRCNIAVDSRNPFVYEAETRDEHQGTWKHNVQNNVDDTVCAKVQLDEGIHTLKITGVDAYFSFSRFVLYYGGKKKDNLAVHLYGTELPAEFDTEAFAHSFYGEFELEPRKVVFGGECAVLNANTDYDEYRPGEKEIGFDEWSDKSYESISNILESGEKIFSEQGGNVSIYAASALIMSEYASINGEGKDLVSYCNSPSFGGTGIAIYMPEHGAALETKEAPVLKYIFETGETGEKTVWMKLFMWGSDRGRFELKLDGVTYTKDNYLVPGVWTYSAENTWRFVPVLRLSIPAGRHELEVKILSRGLRIERIVIGDKEIDKWNS